jgi:hypothetical protein
MEKYTVIDDPHVPEMTEDMAEKLHEWYSEVVGIKAPCNSEPVLVPLGFMSRAEIEAIYPNPVINNDST